MLNTYHNILSAVYVMDLDLKKFDNIKEAINFIENHNVVHLDIHLKNRSDNEKFVEEIKNKYKDFRVLLMQDSFRDYSRVEIIAKDNDKGKNVKRLIQYLNINYDDTLCFGDALNDIDMFKCVKTSVAMGNALPELKENATYITDTNDNDGIYKFLNNYFEIDKGE